MYKNLLKAFAVVFSVLIAQSAWSYLFPVDSQMQRFERLLSGIDSRIAEVKALPNYQSKVGRLDRNGIRENLRDLQNLFRLYKGKSTYDVLKPYYDIVKEFEDYISHRRDYVYFANNASPNTRVHYETLLNDLETKYADLLNNSAWFADENKMTDQIRASLASIEWPSLRKDRDVILSRMEKLIGKYQEKEYPMEEVEYGIHELRRDARRINYLNHPVNIIRTNYEMACPMQEGVEPVKSEKQEAVNYSCEIPGCIMDRLSRYRSDLNWLKSDGLQYELRGEPVAQSILDRAQIVHDEIKQSQVFLYLSYAIRACREPKDIINNNGQIQGVNNVQ